MMTSPGVRGSDAGAPSSISTRAVDRSVFCGDPKCVASSRASVGGSVSSRAGEEVTPTTVVEADPVTPKSSGVGEGGLVTPVSSPVGGGGPVTPMPCTSPAAS